MSYTDFLSNKSRSIFNENLKMSKEDVVYRVLKLGQYPTDPNQHILIGNIIPQHIDKIITAVLSHYFLHVGAKILQISELYHKETDEEVKTFYAKKQQEVLKKQFIIYKDYLKIFKPSYEIMSNFIHLKYYPQSENELKQFAFTFTPDVAGYYKFFTYQKYHFSDFFEQSFKIYLHHKYLEQSSYISGRAGSGKTELMKLLIDGAIRANNSSVVIIDVHGDFSQEIAKTLDKENIDRLIYIDLFAGAQQNIIPSLNPFDINSLDERVLSIATENILNTLKMVIGEKEFTNAMRVLLAPAINTLLRLPNATLLDLYLFMDDKVNADLVQYGIKHCPGLYSHYLQHNFYDKDKTRTKHAIANRLLILLNFQSFREFLTNPSTLNLEEAMNNKKIIIFRFNKILMRESADEICKFLMSTIQTIAMKRHELQKEDRVTTHCFLDEFQNFVSSDISEILSESRKYKLFLHLSHQYISQIESVDLRGSIMSNCGLKFSGINSTAHNNFIAKELNINVQELNRLQNPGDFYFKKNQGEPFYFKASSHLINNATQKEEWHTILQMQLQKYYKQIDPNKALFSNISQKDEQKKESAQTTQKSHRYSKKQQNTLVQLFSDNNLIDF